MAWLYEQPLPRHLWSDKSENVPGFLCHGQLNEISLDKTTRKEWPMDEKSITKESDAKIYDSHSNHEPIKHKLLLFELAFS